MLTARAAVSLAALVSLLAACGPTGEPGVVTPPPPTELRRDTGPLTSRFPMIGEPSTARWVVWNSAGGGDERMPGPTVYWINAVVTLRSATADELVGRYAPTEQGASPEVAELLRPELPPGPYLSGDELNKAFTTAEWLSRAYLHRPSNRLVLTATSA